eukprot:2295651-Amphidinium_carterae.1
MEKAQNAQRSRMESPSFGKGTEARLQSTASVDNETSPDLKTSTMHRNDQRRVQDVEPIGRTDIGAAHL